MAVSARLSLLFLFIPSMLYSQKKVNKGVHFEKEAGLHDVKDQAKREGKYIFIDCFATWCGPCKLMDAEVYTEERVGDYMNAHFLSIRLQMDTSKADDGDVRGAYADAKSVDSQYRITAFPTYLFLSPDGKAVHRATGYEKDSDFLVTAANALDPKTQYYTLLDEYRHGQKAYATMYYLANAVKAVGDYRLADTIARDYVDNYLLWLCPEELYTTKNMEFIGPTVRSSKDKAFRLFYEHPEQVNPLIKWSRDYVGGIVDYIITKEIVTPYLDSLAKFNAAPDWNWVTKDIEDQYGQSYARRNVLSAKVTWYHQIGDWVGYNKFEIVRLNEYPIDSTSIRDEVNLNNFLWEGIFLHSTDKRQIETGVKWMSRLVRRNPGNVGFWDTYANLLYKSGRVQEALRWEGKAATSPGASTDIVKNFELMKDGRKTW
jgi:thioredoxin-related protein